MSAEATVVRNYFDWMIDFPWGNKSKIISDLNSAQKVLDEDHYGLAKLKRELLNI